MTVKTVIKRNGDKVDFDSWKIINAVNKACEAAEESPMGFFVWHQIEEKNLPSELGVEQIQDLVEDILMSFNPKVARKYIRYRYDREQLRMIRPIDLVDKYLDASDWRVKENASVGYSLGGMILNNSGAVTANYWLNKIYPKEIGDAHRDCKFHIHDLSMLSTYCVGHSLLDLIKMGLGGVPGKTTSLPPKHLSTLVNQMVNFTGCMQNEQAGAGAFSSVDTYLAPYIKKDNLSYDEVYQCLQSLIFSLNSPNRWGCVKETTEIMTPDGFKKWNELHVGDMIYTWINGTLHEAPINFIIHRPNDYPVLHRYKGKSYQQTVTPCHRCLLGSSSKNYRVLQSRDIFGAKLRDPRFPVSIKTVDVSYETKYSDDEIRLAAMYYADGNRNLDCIQITKSLRRDKGDIKRVLDNLGLEYGINQQTRRGGKGTSEVYRYTIRQKHRRYIERLIGDKYKINPDFLKLNKEQSFLFFKTWASFDGSVNGRISCQYDNDDIRDSLEIIAARAGYMTHLWQRQKVGDKKPTKYVYMDMRIDVCLAEEEEIPYTGYVWCPNTDDGTAIYRDEDGFLFISGNSQPPFTNFTLDWRVPKDLAETYCWVGDKQEDFKYKDCQEEMNMINEILLDIFDKGDADGRGFAYPICTYNVTKEFDWKSNRAKKLFEITSKYGMPYFQNFINSDLHESDVRAMCPIPGNSLVRIKASPENQDFLIKIKDIDLKEFYVPFGSEWKKATLVKTPITDIYGFAMEDESVVRFGRDHEHPIIRNNEYQVIQAKDIKPGDYFIYENDNGQYVKKVLATYTRPNDEPLYCVAIPETQEPRLDYILDGVYVDTTHLFVMPDGLITSNCRLRLDKRELMKRGGGLFGAAEQTGSIGVVTINLPQLGYLFKGDKDGFYKELDRLLVLAKTSLVIKRGVIEKLKDGGFYPYEKVYIHTFDTFFNTIGINGCNECIRNFTNDKHNIADEWGQAFTNELLDYINSRLSDFQEETGLLFNLEATPAEGTGYRFALHDKKNYPDIITANDNGDPYYTNSTWLPATYTDDIFEALDIQDQFQTKYTGGTVFHAYLGERVHNWKACAELIKSIFTNYRLPYLTISPTFSVCPKHGYLDGEQKYCPRCRDEQLREIDQKIEDIQKELEVADDEN